MSLSKVTQFCFAMCRSYVRVPLLGAFVVGCADPVLDAQIDALPAEVPGIPPGPLHRAGQPCTDCHSPYGQRTPSFSVAGTIFLLPTGRVAVPEVQVHVIDAAGTVRDLVSNCAGNFYVTTSEWEPMFPLFVSLQDTVTGTTVTMLSKIGRNASCAACHADPAGTDSPGHLYLTTGPSAPAGVPPLGCGR
jgi:hypothetical protein